VYGTECWKFGFVHPPYGVVYLCTVEVVLNRDALNVLDHDTAYAIEQAHCFLLDARFAAILQSIDPRSKLAVNPIEFRVPITGTGMPNIQELPRSEASRPSYSTIRKLPSKCIGKRSPLSAYPTGTHIAGIQLGEGFCARTSVFRHPDKGGPPHSTGAPANVCGPD